MHHNLMKNRVQYIRGMKDKHNERCSAYLIDSSQTDRENKLVVVGDY
uniref:Uncharacterized protein n=1 Tax=Arundo donax TaxID=35708 RepID=A0A0A8Y3D5_ARUDO